MEKRVKNLRTNRLLNPHPSTFRLRLTWTMYVHIEYVGSANVWLKVPPTEAKEAHVNGLTSVVMGTGCLKLGFLHVQTNLFPQILSI